MIEPSERDREMAFELCRKARLSVKHNAKVFAEALAAAGAAAQRDHQGRA